MTKFYYCPHCGNLITKFRDSGNLVVCCGDEMIQLKPNSVDAAVEKHVPAVTVNGNEVTAVIGSVEHPMTDEHYIEWIYFETKTSGQVVYLKPGAKPEAKFLTTNPVTKVYAYCNLHGLWQS